MHGGISRSLNVKFKHALGMTNGAGLLGFLFFFWLGNTVLWKVLGHLGLAGSSPTEARTKEGRIKIMVVL